MSANNNKIIGGVSTIIHSLAVPLFFLFFIIFYKPHTIYGLLNMQHAGFTFNATLLFCIVLVTTDITRGSLYLVGKYKTISPQIYFSWCFAEMIIMALFASLYVTLMLKEPMSFFEVTGNIVVLIITTTIYPYAFIWFKYEIHEKGLENNETPDENSLIRFYDEYKKLRLVIARDAVLFIKSEENYVHIFYLDQGKNKKFTLRSSMRALEETAPAEEVVEEKVVLPKSEKLTTNLGSLLAGLNLPEE